MPNHSAIHGLYAITDASLLQADTFEKDVEKALIGGANIIQYRDKSNDKNKRLQQASALKKLCLQHHKLLIINDDINLALLVDADGVHLGQQDKNLRYAREQFGKNKIIGITCHNDLALAITAQKQGADYVAFGAFFPSKTKPNAQLADQEILQQAKQQLTLPLVAIGGITLDNAGSLIKAGADAVATVGGLFAQDDIHKTAIQFSQLF